MALLVSKPALIKASGTKEKIIKEYIGRVNSSTTEASIAIMKSPEGWDEPGQTPEFDEYTIVLKGKLKVTTQDQEVIVNEGEAIIATKGEWVKYSSPFEEGAEYIAVCIPAFSPETVNRDTDPK
jgi:ethanolamine utilization protein EutQ (cupin superfamily)